MLMRVLADDKSFTDLIIELNTRKQLYDRGVNADGVKLSDIGDKYSPYTLDLHPEKIADRITLYDTGDFYESFKVFLNSSNELVISANTIKDTSDLIADWGEKILGLNKESLSILREKAKDVLIPFVKKQLLTR